jgi:hypothetical protein
MGVKAFVGMSCFIPFLVCVIDISVLAFVQALFSSFCGDHFFKESAWAKKKKGLSVGLGQMKRPSAKAVWPIFFFARGRACV